MDKNKMRLLGGYNYIKLTCLEYMTRVIQKIKKDFSFLMTVRLRGYSHPIWIRTGTSDYACFHLIFIQEEFEKINSMLSSDIKYMIDCGTNVGYTIRYFANKRQNLQFIGIEPDLSNFEIAKKNTAYFTNVTLLQRAIWPNTSHVKVVQGNFGNGGKWALEVIECNKNEGIETLTINDIIKDFEQEAIFIKMDIEGSEKKVLKENTNWANHISFLCVELHDAEAENVFKNFRKDYNFLDKGLIGEMHCLLNPNKQ